MGNDSKKHILVFAAFLIIFGAFAVTFFLFISDAKRLHQKGELHFPIKRPGNITQHP